MATESQDIGSSLDSKPEACYPLAGGCALAPPPASVIDTTHPEKVPQVDIMPSSAFMTITCVRLAGRVCGIHGECFSRIGGAKLHYKSGNTPS
jgi:hypothetical protein